VVDFSDFSDLALSVEDDFRVGGEGFCVVPTADSVFDVKAAVDVWELILLSDLIASLVENIRVRRLVIDGFSAAATARAGFCGSESGAA
jgi:hypothetical protein